MHSRVKTTGILWGVTMIKFLALIFLSTQTFATVIQEPESLNLKGIGNTSISSKITHVRRFGGTGKISGHLTTIDNNQTIANDALLKIVLLNRENTDAIWAFAASQDVVDSQYEFDGLSDGEYLLKVSTEYNPGQQDRPFYLPMLWSADGDLQVNTINPKRKFIIQVVNGEALTDIDFSLTAAGILVVTNNISNGLELDKAFVIDENNDIKPANLVVTQLGGVGSSVVTSQVFFSILAVGSYRFYVDSNNSSFPQSGERRTDMIYGYGPCYNCRAELLNGKGMAVNINRFEQHEVDVELALGSSFSGKMNFEDSGNINGSIYAFNTNGKIVAHSKLCNPFVGSCSEDNSYQISGLVEGEYFVTFSGGKSVRTLLGG
jgi:hypothetical protein